MINHKFDLGKFFKGILYRVGNWNNERFGWIVEKIFSQYINVSTFRPLWGSHYIILPAKLKNPKKGQINIKNNDEKCYLYCHIRDLNPLQIHPERITKQDKESIKTLHYEIFEFPVSKKDFNKTELKSKICINPFQANVSFLYPLQGGIEREYWPEMG